MDEQLLRQIVKFTKRVKRDRYAKVYGPLGDGLRRVGLLTEATETCKKGLEIFPRYLACHEALGKIYLRQNKLADARRELEKVHAVIGENLELRKALAKVYARSGDRGQAAELMDWIIAADPFDFEMRNLRTQLRKAVATPESEGALDIYELAERPAVVDIRSIIEQTPEPAGAADRHAVKRATDTALDELEGIEVVIDAEADRLFEAAGDTSETGKKKSKKKGRRTTAQQQKMIEKSVEEISAAAVIAQVELEISLLDEASIVCRRLLDQQPDDVDIQELAAKFTQRLEEKEAELEKLESINLARGL
jgi:tetratricopeptide (TPR) repeat protein